MSAIDSVTDSVGALRSTQLVLGSTSRYRRELLARLEVPFTAIAPAYDEAQDRHLFESLGPFAFAEHLATRKAQSIVPFCQEEQHILAADQIAITNYPHGPCTLLCKPETPENAIRQLKSLRGGRHDLITAVVLLCVKTGEHELAFDHHEMYMRNASDAFIERYIAKYRPLDCVGSYRIEDAGIGLFERIVGTDFTGIIGLPLLTVAQLLRKQDLLRDDDAIKSTV